MTLQDYVSISAALETILLMVLLRFLVKLYRARITIATLRKQGLVWHFDMVLITRGLIANASQADAAMESITRTPILLL